MILAIDPARAVPVYEQVREQVVRMVLSGVLPAGARLPTIRQLATDLGLAKGTVAKAYELLESDAMIETRGRKGSYVREHNPERTVAGTADLAATAEALVVAALQIGVDQAEMSEALDDAWRRLSG